jgi:sugar phosphate isomerase/epimerase
MTAAPRFACMELMWGDVSGAKLEPWLDETRAIGFGGVAMRRTTLWPFVDEPQRFAALLSARGLSLVGAYSTIDTAPADIERFCGFLSALGCHDLVLHGGQRAGAPERAQLARLLDERGALCARHGVRVSFHHHTHVPFETYEETAELLRLTDARHVHLFCDTGHATKDFVEFPVARRAYELLVRHWDRVSYIEFKDWSAAGDFATDLGCGEADLRPVAALIRERAFPGWIVLEQNAPSAGSTPGQSAERGLRFARELFAQTASSTSGSHR